MVIIPVAREISSMSSLTHRTFGRFSWRLSCPLAKPSDPVWMARKPSKGHFTIQKFPWGECPRTPLEAYAFIAWENRRHFATPPTVSPRIDVWQTLRNERRNSILMTRHYPDLGSASDWSCHVGNLLQPIRSTTQIWVVTRHQYGISALVSQTSIRGETAGAVAKYRLFSQANAFSARLANQSVFIQDPNLNSAIVTGSSYNSTWS